MALPAQTFPLFPHLAAPKRPVLPKKLYRQLAPANPFARIGWYASLHLLENRRLSETIRDEQLAKIRANSTWLTAFEMLEKRGLHLGVSVAEVAEQLGVKPQQAKRAMLKAEEALFIIYGINVCFVDGNGKWRLATEREVAVKYAQMLKQVSKTTTRLRFYQGAARDLGERRGTLNIPLFELPEV
ncbi:hypothetical protein ACMT4L_07785 [Deinococcus sp. A31D244]|uniref:hypothetical protein n=1 Tax=Deinococcus sp. A31D244 TaxID=3397675 RepID=UPI0039E020CF